MVATRTYLTGGLGSRHRDEAFGDPFELPPDRAYAETCAAIASVMLGWRLLLATGEPRFADQIERTMLQRGAVRPLARRDATSSTSTRSSAGATASATTHADGARAPVVPVRLLPAQPDAAAGVVGAVPRDGRRRRRPAPPVRDARRSTAAVGGRPRATGGRRPTTRGTGGSPSAWSRRPDAAVDPVAARPAGRGDGDARPSPGDAARPSRARVAVERRAGGRATRSCSTSIWRRRHAVRPARRCHPRVRRPRARAARLLPSRAADLPDGLELEDVERGPGGPPRRRGARDLAAGIVGPDAAGPRPVGRARSEPSRSTCARSRTSPGRNREVEAMRVWIPAARRPTRRATTRRPRLTVRRGAAPSTRGRRASARRRPWPAPAAA